jgi:hypothetical protein
MASPREYREVINGRLTIARPRRGYVEVDVYAGPEQEGEPVGQWDMPNEFRNTLYLAAKQGELQTPRTNTEGDKA